jgi:hypothetical protein
MTTTITISVDFGSIDDEPTTNGENTGKITVTGTNMSEELARAAAAHGLAMETGCSTEEAEEALEPNHDLELEPHQATIGFTY